MPNLASAARFLSPSRSWDFPLLDDASPSPHEEGRPSEFGPRGKIGVAAVVGLVSLAVVVVSAGIVWRTIGSQASAPVVVEPVSGGQPSEAQTLGQPPAATSLPAEVVVHVSGAVVRPGLVELPDGSRVHDAIEAAGGPLAEADTGAINLARTLVDGEQVIVPLWGEATPRSPSDPGGPISLNSGDASALDQLPGIGPSLAQRIVDWRETHGPFVSVEDVLAVPGIGESTLARFRELVVP